MFNNRSKINRIFDSKWPFEGTKNFKKCYTSCTVHHKYLTSMCEVTDIPDWTFNESGLNYTWMNPSPEMYQEMWARYITTLFVEEIMISLFLLIHLFYESIIKIKRKVKISYRICKLKNIYILFYIYSTGCSLRYVIK